MADPTILADNARELARLEALLAKLTDADLRIDLGEGWDVAISLAHMAFWDRRAVFGLQRWAKEGTPVNADDDHILNEALYDEWKLIEPRTALQMALDAAREVDATAASMPDSVYADAASRDLSWVLRRAGHRAEHIEQIEAALRA